MNVRPRPRFRPVLALFAVSSFVGLWLLAPAVSRAATCYPSCIEDLRAACPPVSPCTKNVPAVPTDASIAAYCFANGVKIEVSNYASPSATSTQSRTKPDGSPCYAVDQPPGTGTTYTSTWKNAAGAIVATESYDYLMMGGRYHSVSCGGASYSVDVASPECDAEQMVQNPDVDTLCTPSADCGASGGQGGAPGGAGGAGGTAGVPAPGAGGAGGSSSGCAANQTSCGGGCVDLAGDNLNCGVCGNACTTGFTCTQGACMLVLCPLAGQSHCGAACINLLSDAQNCGTCGHVCPLGQVCSAGVCGASCFGNMLMCGQDCKDFSDARSCGSCAVVCGPNQVCCSAELDEASQCGGDPNQAASAYACRTCKFGEVECGNSCTNLQEDNDNCGQCAVSCQGHCVAGKCNTDANRGGGCAVGPSPLGATLQSLVVVLLLFGAGLWRRRLWRRAP